MMLCHLANLKKSEKMTMTELYYIKKHKFLLEWIIYHYKATTINEAKSKYPVREKIPQILLPFESFQAIVATYFPVSDA